MTATAFARNLALAVVALSSAACVFGAKLREDAKLIEKKIANARERGSYRCAPKELARAEAMYLVNSVRGWIRTELR